ncbi:MAG: histidine kinase [Candidatus Omnitrophica bacterium]|nr:histidine kinase [Candidatus Omnitrophota bacterium]
MVNVNKVPAALVTKLPYFRALIKNFLTIFLGFFICFAFQRSVEAATKEEVIAKYENVGAELRQLEKQGYQIYLFLEEFDRSALHIANGNLADANRKLDDLKGRLKPLHHEEIFLPFEAVQVRWLEIYGDLLQKFAMLLIVSYFLMRARNFRNLFMRTHREERVPQLLISGTALTLISILAGGLGYLRYGESDWAFLDLQLIFVTISGLVGGMSLGIFSGVVGGVFRLFLGAGHGSYFLILIGAGLIGAAFSVIGRDRMLARKIALLAGISVGLFHGLVTYLPIAKYLSFGMATSIIFSLAVLESLCVYVFVALAQGLIREEERRTLEKLLPEMKLKFLQAQINPHFLFNALNTIAAICSREQAEQARNLVVKLSNYFRRIVKREDEFVSLEEEFEHIDSYLEIEKARYQDSLKIRKEIQLGSKGFQTQIPVLILQPIVENAIRHGLALKSGGGVLEISARENAKYVEITVKDTGVGISQEYLRNIKLKKPKSNQPSEEGKGSGIGLWNINERLKYQFGIDSELKIESEIGQGTSVRFRIPIENPHQQKEQ